MTGEKLTFTRPTCVHASLAMLVGAIMLLALVTACGGGAAGSDAKTYDVQASLASLKAAGWTVAEAPGMPDTLTQARQVGYLEAIAPDGQKIDMQFLEIGAKATAELAAVQKQSASFRGTTIANVMVFSHAMGDTEVPAADLDALQKLLK